MRAELSEAQRQLQQIHQKHELENQAKHKELQALEIQLTTLKDDHEVVLKQLVDAKANAQSREREAKELAAYLEDTKLQFNSLNQDNNWNQQTIADYQTTLKSLENQLIESNDEKVTLDIKANRLAIANTALQAAVTDLTSQVKKR